MHQLSRQSTLLRGSRLVHASPLECWNGIRSFETVSWYTCRNLEEEEEEKEDEDDEDEEVLSPRLSLSLPTKTKLPVIISKIQKLNWC